MTLLLIAWMEQTLLDKQRRLRNLYKIVDKLWETITFFPNQWQLLLMEAKQKSRKARNWVCRLINLKARQLGITTFELIDWLDDCLFKRNQTITISAHKIDKMKDFFQKVKYAYDNIPDGIKDDRVPWWAWMKPKPQYNNVNELYFPDNNSKIKITLDTRSWTPTRLHITELAFKEWAEEMMAGTLPSLPASADGTIETTANGIWWYFHETRTKNYWKQYWEWAWDCFFIPRYTDPLYVSDKQWYLPDEYHYIRLLKNKWELLSEQQINWYCEKIEELWDTVKQEFPSFPEEAFLTSWRPVFNTNTVKALEIPRHTIDTVFPDLKRFIKDSNRKAIVWVDTSEWWAWWDPASIKVRDQQTMELLASYNWHIEADSLCEVIDRIDKVYPYNVIAIEKNNTWLATILEAKKFTWYRKLYATKILDTKTMKTTDKVWWVTSTATRPLMIQEYESAIRTWVITQVDEDHQSEMYTFVYNSKNKPEAIQWYHDDDIMSDAICYQMRHERIEWWEKQQRQRNLAISAITNRPIMQPTNRRSLQWNRWYSGISGRPL